jgi:poly(3-hydroxybutyrate) depolymerase
MRNGPNNDIVAVADEARSRWRDATPPNVALLVVHGDHDDVVAPANAAALVRQYLRFNGDTLVSSNLPLRGSDASSHEAAGVRYGLRTDDWWIDGRVRVRGAMVEGLGHAWSGGDAKRAFSDARGPDALELFERFVGDAEGRDRQSRIARLLGTGARALTATPK